MRRTRASAHLRGRGRVLAAWRRAASLVALTLCAALLSAAAWGALRPREATVAYFVQVSGATAGLLPGLLAALCTPGAGARRDVLAVHFDRSLPDAAVAHALRRARGALDAAGCVRAGVRVVRPREHVTYRGATLALNYLTGAAHLLAAGARFDYLVNLSGADFPTARPALVRALLARDGPRAHRLSFVEWKPPATWARFARRRLGRVYVDPALASGARGEYEIPPGDAGAGGNASADPLRNPLFRHVRFAVAKSSGWFIWHRELVEFLVLSPAVRRLIAVFALSDAADEHVFASAIWNDPYFRDRAVNANWRNIFFVAPNGSFALAEDGVTRSRQHPYYVDDTDEHGRALFWDKLWEAPGFFTRKVREMGPFTERIAREMLGKGGKRQQEYEQRLSARFDDVIASHLRAVPSLEKEGTPEFRTKFVVT